MFPQFLTSVTLRFPLDEVLRVFGYASETKVETPGNRKSRVIMAAAKLFEKRRAKENAAVRAMVRYRQSTRAKKQKRRWIPFVVKWKKTINICLAIFVVRTQCPPRLQCFLSNATTGCRVNRRPPDRCLES